MTYTNQDIQNIQNQVIQDLENHHGHDGFTVGELRNIMKAADTLSREDRISQWKVVEGCENIIRQCKAAAVFFNADENPHIAIHDGLVVITTAYKAW